MKRILAVLVGTVVLTGCGINDKMNEKRGRGDAATGKIDDEPKEVIQFPDRFSNVAHACDGHGHRVYVSTKSDGSRAMFVTADPTCGSTE